MANNHKGLVVNEYRWIYSNKGIHTFSKKIGKAHSKIDCTEEQLFNGDIELMTKHGISLNPDKIKKEQEGFIGRS